MTNGSRAGASFILSATDENRLGRAIDSAIVLSDPLCSRLHAVIVREEGAWVLRDSESRNGAYVNDQKVDEATLTDGNHVRLGSTEFIFHLTDQPPTTETPSGIGVTQTIQRNQPIEGHDVEVHGLAAISDARQTQELLLLYQLSIKLLGCDSPDEVTRIGLELLLEWTKATVAGFLWVSDDGALKPKLLIPADAAPRVTLSRTLTEMVCNRGNAVWINNQRASTVGSGLQHYADAICVPLVRGGATIGAIHIYLDKGHFRQSDFDFAISLANIMAVSLARARRDVSLRAEFQRLAAETASDDELLGDSPPMLELKGKIGRLARATGCILVRGESGSGKELVARALHWASPRADRPMLSVNCAAIPPSLMESQLFGHKAGSFTGADRDHSGYFQQSDLGTLFLDEVGELTLEGQAKLLRILEGHPFLPVGATKEVSVDVRVIAATNQDLQDYVRAKKFREDLFYRLTVFELNVPPLRERGADIGRLIDHFFDHYRLQHGRMSLRLSDAARSKLLSYSWPGNVRQLRNAIDSAVVLAENDEVLAGDLQLRDTTAELESLKMDYWEKRLIGEALKRTGGKAPAAAELLGIGRATLYRKIEEYGLKRDSARDSV